MDFDYTNSLDQYSATFPSGVFAPHDFRNFEPDGIATTDTFAVPGAIGGKHRHNLSYVPRDQVGITITVDSEARVIIPYGESPAPGEVAVSLTTGALEFHSSDEGLSVEAIYTGKGTPVMAHHLNQLGAELEATQDRLDSLYSASGVLSPSTILIGSSGTVSAPSLAWQGDGNTGFYKPSDATVGLSVDGTQVLAASGSAVDAFGKFSVSASGDVAASGVYKASNGTVGAPAHTFASDTDTGIYRAAANSVGIAASGQPYIVAGPNNLNLYTTTPASGSAGTLTIQTGSSDDGTGGSINVYTGYGSVKDGSMSVILNTATTEAGDFTMLCGALTIESNDLYVNSGVLTPTVALDAPLVTANTLSVDTDGSASAPSIRRASDTNTGLYFPGADQVAIATSGTQRFLASDTAITTTVPVLHPSGTVAAPAIAFADDTNTGIYLSAADTMVLVANGSARLTVNDAGVYTSKQIYGVDGSASFPMYSFANDGDCGLYRSGTNQVSIAANGAQKMIFDANFITAGVQFFTTGGSASFPSYSFSGDGNTGIYPASADTIGLATSGTLRASVSTSALTSTLPVRGENGTSSAPTYSFTNDIDTGIYRVGTNSLGIAAGTNILGVFGSSNVALTAVSGNDEGGSITLQAGDASAGDGGGIGLNTGAGDDGVGGDFTVTVGPGTTKDGNVAFYCNTATNEAGNFNVNGAYDVTVEGTHGIALTGNTSVTGTLSVSSNCTHRRPSIIQSSGTVTLSQSQSGTTIFATNCEVVLPTVASGGGVWFRVWATAFEDVFVRAASSQNLKYGGGTYIGGTDRIYNSGAPNSYLDVQCDGTNWQAVSAGGSWSVEP